MDKKYYKMLELDRRRREKQGQQYLGKGIWSRKLSEVEVKKFEAELAAFTKASRKLKLVQVD